MLRSSDCSEQSGQPCSNAGLMASVATLRMAKSGTLTTSTLPWPPESEITRSASKRVRRLAVRRAADVGVDAVVLAADLVGAVQLDHRDAGRLGGVERLTEGVGGLARHRDVVGAAVDGLLHRRARALRVGRVVAERGEVPAEGVGGALEAGGDRQDRLDVALEPVHVDVGRDVALDRCVDADRRRRLQERGDAGRRRGCRRRRVGRGRCGRPGRSRRRGAGRRGPTARMPAPATTPMRWTARRVELVMGGISLGFDQLVDGVRSVGRRAVRRRRGWRRSTPASRHRVRRRRAHRPPVWLRAIAGACRRRVAGWRGRRRARGRRR